MYVRLLNFLQKLINKTHSRLLRHLGGFGHFGPASVHLGVRITNPQGMRIEKGALILRGTWLYCLPSEETGERPDLRIGEDTYIGFYSHISCARKVHLGKGCLIANSVYIADCDHIYDDISVSPRWQPMKIGTVEIGDGTWIGEHACVFGTVKIGQHCVIGANSVVSDVTIPDYCVVAGIPARIVKRYDEASRRWRRTDRLGNFLDDPRALSGA